MKVREAYRRVLGNGHLSRLLFGEFVSSIGDWLYLVALLIVIYERSADPFVLGIVGAARVVPYILLSLPAGIAADRYDRRMILLVTDLARGAIMLLMAAVVVFDGPVDAIIALAIVATCFSAFFSPAIGSYIPSLVRDESELGPANSTWSTLDNLAFIVGPAVAGILIGLGGLAVAFLLNAASFLVVAAVLWRLPVSRARRPFGDKPTAGGDDRDEDDRGEAPSQALRAVLRLIAAPLIGLTLVAVVGSFVTGGLGVLTVIIAIDVLGSGDTGTGLLNAAVGVGGLIGALVSTGLVVRRRQAPPFLFGGVLMALSVAGLGWSGTLGLAMLAMAGAAAGGLLVEIVSTTLFQRLVPDEVRGRTLGAMETVAVAAYAAGAFAIPALLLPLGIETVLLVAALVMAASVLVAVPMLGQHAIATPPQDAAREHLLRVAIFAGLSPARLEAAMSQSSVETYDAGRAIVTQGDPAERFFVIVDGTVQVTQHDPLRGPDVVLRKMGPDEMFGEIGLLAGGIRTATVTALVPVTLLALDRGSFMELAGAGPGLTSRLLDLHRGAVPLGAVRG